jgi:hypothetical protein
LAELDFIKNIMLKEEKDHLRLTHEGSETGFFTKILLVTRSKGKKTGFEESEMRPGLPLISCCAFKLMGLSKSVKGLGL